MIGTLGYRVLARARIEPALVELARVIVIVLADAQNVLRGTRKRRVHLHASRRNAAFAALHRAARALQAFLAERHELRHVARQAARRREVDDRVGFESFDADAHALRVGKVTSRIFRSSSFEARQYACAPGRPSMRVRAKKRALEAPFSGYSLILRYFVSSFFFGPFFMSSLDMLSFDIFLLCLAPDMRQLAEW